MTFIVMSSPILVLSYIKSNKKNTNVSLDIVNDEYKTKQTKKLPFSKFYFAKLNILLWVIIHSIQTTAATGALFRKTLL